MNKEARVGLFIIIATCILFYFSVNIGSINLWTNSYFVYKTYFDDVAGLEPKAHVKISGFTVGWVESISLNDKGKAEVTVRINRNHKLFKNSYATITQDTLLGTKMLEIDSGESSSGLLPPGSVLHMPGRSSASLGDILERVKDITDAVQEVSFAFNRVFASSTGEERMKKALDDVGKASDQVANMTVKFNKIVDDNKDKVNEISDNLNTGISSFAKIMPDVQTIVDKTKADIDAVSNDLKSTMQNANQVSKSACNISEKIESGEGTIGKLVVSDEMYNSVKESVDSVKDMLGKAKNLEINLDGNSCRFARIDNSRGEGNITLRFRDDYFYILQVSADEVGKFKHKTTYTDYYYEDNSTTVDRYQNSVGVNDPNQTTSMNGYHLSQVAPVIRKSEVDKTSIRIGMQIAKKFDCLVLRAGMIEDTFGMAIDYDIPLKNTTTRWLTSLEAFDFSGFNRINDTRPHLRWSNKVFVFHRFYTYFGFDDFVSKRNASIFFGGGVSFNDDDLKYFLYSFAGKIFGS